MTLPVVTIILPTYRRPRLLARALRSVLAQTRGDFVVMVCDNDSADETAEVVANFAARDPRVMYHCNERNIGALSNFREAFSRVKTEYFCLFSDDDILLPECLAIELAGLERYPNAMAWGGIVISMKEKNYVGCKPPQSWPEGFSNHEDACKLVCSDQRPETTGMLFRSSVIDSDFHPTHLDFFAADVNWVLHAAAKGGIGITRLPVAVFIQHAGSLSTGASEDIEAVSKIYWPSVKYMVTYFPQGRLNEKLRQHFRKRILYFYGTRKFWVLGRIAAIKGRDLLVKTCVRQLRVDMGSSSAAFSLTVLAAIPPFLLRLYFKFFYEISMKRLISGRRTNLELEYEAVAGNALADYEMEFKDNFLASSHVGDGIRT